MATTQDMVSLLTEKTKSGKLIWKKHTPLQHRMPASWVAVAGECSYIISGKHASLSCAFNGNAFKEFHISDNEDIKELLDAVSSMYPGENMTVENAIDLAYAYLAEK